MAISGGATAQVAAVGTIAKVAGAVSIARQSQTLAASAGLGLLRGDRVVTGADGRVEIAGIDGSSLVIGPGSQVTITQYSAAANSARSVLLDLIEGILRFVVKPAGVGYDVEVRTPTAVASVRSTEWIVDASAETTGVLALEGSVEVAGTRGNDAVLITPGQGTDVRRGASPTPPAAWAQARIDGVLARTRSP